MTSDRWEHVERLFEQAADLPAGARAAFLDTACRSPEGVPDPSLREEVEALLAADSGAEGYLGRLNAEVLGPALDAALAERDPMAGTLVGPYRVGPRLGQGGMGTVYRAERADDTFAQTVALKLVRPGLAPEVTARFRAERSILARLEHPHIARLLDGGVTEPAGDLGDGRPWLAMEFVDGEPITAYCDRKRLSVNERLALFETVCEAVAFAHRNLVVHRDLKPSNILVTDDRTVKLLDFGIAKLLEDDAPFTVAETRVGVQVMTPEYAAPEQVRAEAVTVATDVYALGILLYELLTGRRPYQLSTRARHEMERAILEEAPTRPSTAVTEPLATAGDTLATTPDTLSRARRADTSALRRRLAGDLDQIVLTALRKEPERRYGSADAFADDVRRHLGGLPVKARPDTAGYRTRKFVRRHRLGIGAAALVFLALAAGLGVALWQAAEARAAEARAETEALTATATADFLASLFSAADPGVALGDSLTANDLLVRGAERLEDELADEPLVRAQILDAIAGAHLGLGDYARADTLFRRIIDVLGPVRADEPVRYAMAVGNLGMTRGRLGDLAGSERYLTDAVALYEAAGDTLSLDFGSTLNQFAIMRYRQGRYDEAIPSLQRVIAVDRAVSEAEGAPVPGLAIHIDNLGSLFLALERFEEAEPLMREGLALHRALLGDRHPTVAVSLGNLATMLGQMDRFEEAEALSRDALALSVELLSPDHPNVAVAQSKLATILARQERFDEAQPLFEQSLATRRVVFGNQHPRTATGLISLGTTLRQRGRPGEAIPLLREALGITEALLPPGHTREVDARAQLARALDATGDTAGARAVLQRGLARLDTLDEPNDAARTTFEETLAELDG